jgi:carboxyl-terminal processing protease
MSLHILRRLRVGSVILLLTAMLGATPAVAQDTSPDPEASPAASTGPASSPDAGSSPDPECVEPEASPAPVDETLSMPEEFRIALFNSVWEGIRDYYVDPETNGLDWEAIGDEYAPLVIGTEDAHEVYDLLREMVGLLEDPFTNFFSPEELGDPEVIDPSYGGIGALIDESVAGEGSDGLRIIYVFEGGSAKAGGLDVRDRVLGVNGEPCARIADIRGPQGTEVTLTVVSPGEEPREITLERRQIDPVILPEARRLEADPSMGYLRVIALSGEEAIDAIDEALTGFVSDEPIEGLIIDLRTSNQGAPGVMLELLRAFVSGDVGEFHSRVGNEPIQVEPNDLAEAYADIPVVVLVDEASEAEAEQFAAIIQDQGRGVVVGTQTSGQTHGAQTVDLPDGSLLQIVAFGFQLPDGETLEGRGVTPDVEVAADWLDYPESEDPFMLAALEVLGAADGSPAEEPTAEGSPAGEPTAEGSPEAAPTAEGSPEAAPTAEGSPAAAPTAEGSPSPVAAAG